MIYLPTVGGSRMAFEIERIQIVNSPTGVFTRVTTVAISIPPADYRWIRSSQNSDACRWQIDGIDCNLSCRNITFEVPIRKPTLLTSLLIDLYFPINYAVDVNFMQYVPSYTGTERFGSRYDLPTPIYERPTAVTNASTRPERMGRNTRRTAPTNLPSQQLSLDPGNIQESTPTQHGPTEPEKQPPVERKPASYLRKFKNIQINEDM